MYVCCLSYKYSVMCVKGLFLSSSIVHFIIFLFGLNVKAFYYFCQRFAFVKIKFL